jgi:hypothetical protein
MSRLIVVSNRVNPPTGKGEESVGGLAMALAAALREYSGIWFGWSGKTTTEFTGQLNMHKADGVTVATVDLEEGDYQEYYNGYANKTLWPLFHYRVDLTAYDRSFGEGYDRVNKRFAETLLPLIEPDDIIWVHDYHLIPMARELRRLGVTNRIGFFLHIPWPAHQLVVTLPRHRPLVEALFHYDLVGFQTEESVQAFEGYVFNEVGGERTEDGRLTAFGQVTQAAAFPIGIDAEDFARIKESPRATRVYDRLMAHSVFRKMVVGRRSPGLFQGAGGAADRLRALPARQSRGPPRGHAAADRPDLARRGRGLPGPARAAGRPDRPDQRRLCRHGLQPDPLPQSQLSPRRAGRGLSRRQGRPGHPAARRHEPGGQGVRGLADALRIPAC